MNYNPYTPKVKKAESDVAALTSALKGLESELSWFREFDAAGARENLQLEFSRMEAGSRESQNLNTEIDNLEKQIAELTLASKIGWERSHWPWASERRTAKKSWLKRLGQLSRQNSLRSNATDNENNARKSIDEISVDLDKFNAFNESIITEEISSLLQQIELGKKEISELKDEKGRIDLLIANQVKNIEEIDGKLSELNSKLSEAENMEERLSRANNGYERKLIHEKCAKQFDDGSPNKVIRQLTKEIGALKRNKRKIEDRITKTVTERGSQDIRSVVIDGSNLCYDGDMFIGLSALQKLCKEIPEDINIEVVFDGSILKSLGLRDAEQLYTRMAGIKVHLDDNPSGADEMILNAALKPTSYVISGDKFGDFADKPAVRENRVLRVRFINGTVQVRRMDISFEY